MGRRTDDPRLIQPRRDDARDVRAMAVIVLVVSLVLPGADVDTTSDVLLEIWMVHIDTRIQDRHFYPGAVQSRIILMDIWDANLIKTPGIGLLRGGRRRLN